MNASGGSKSRNDLFLDTLTDELNETPVAELLNGSKPEDAQQLAARLVKSSREEAGRQGLAQATRAGAVSGNEARDPNVKPLEQELADKLGAKVAIQHSAVGNGHGEPIEAPGKAAAGPEPVAERMGSLQQGAIVRGTVKSITDFGAFIDLGGIDGLLLLPDFSWKRVRHPSDVVTVGDAIDVLILAIDRKRARVSLGLKQLLPDPWDKLSRRYPPRSRLVGKVTHIADYGALVEIEQGVEGLVHVSEMVWGDKNVDPAKVVHVGEQVEVMVLKVEEEHRRLSLGLRQCRQAEPIELMPLASPPEQGRNTPGAKPPTQDPLPAPSAESAQGTIGQGGVAKGEGCGVSRKSTPEA